MRMNEFRYCLYLCMMRRSLFILMLTPCLLWAQQTVQISALGNYKNIYFGQENDVRKLDSLPEKLEDLDIIMIFSGSTSQLSSSDVERLVQFMNEGGGLYLGAENWPLQAECNQLTNRLFNKEIYGEYEQSEAVVSLEEGNIQLIKENRIPAGATTVAFPMDHRLKVEAWVEDQPLILSGQVGHGHVIIDGGYSRFYSDRSSKSTMQLMQLFIGYLKGK